MQKYSLGEFDARAYAHGRGVIQDMLDMTGVRDENVHAVFVAVYVDGFLQFAGADAVAFCGRLGRLTRLSAKERAQHVLGRMSTDGEIDRRGNIDAGGGQSAGNVAELIRALEWIGADIERQAALDEEMSTDDAVRVGVIREALKKKPRNCDRFGGDQKMLHTAWFDWSGSPSGCNPDGTVKLTFGEWLLAPSTEKGGAV